MGELRSLMVKTSNLHPNCFLRHKFMLKPNLNLLSLLVNNYRSILWWHGKQTGWDDPVIKKRKKKVEWLKLTIKKVFQSYVPYVH